MSAERRDEAVQFEIPDLAAAARLTRLLAGLWHVSLHDRSDINLVVAVLR